MGESKQTHLNIAKIPSESHTCVRTHTQFSPNLHEIFKGLRLFPLIYFLNPSKPFPPKVFTRCLHTTPQNSSRILQLYSPSMTTPLFVHVYNVSSYPLPQFPSSASQSLPPHPPSNLLTSFHSPLRPLSQCWPSLPECGTIHCHVGVLAENTLLKNKLVLSKAPQFRGGAA